MRRLPASSVSGMARADDRLWPWLKLHQPPHGDRRQPGPGREWSTSSTTAYGHVKPPPRCRCGRAVSLAGPQRRRTVGTSLLSWWCRRCNGADALMAPPSPSSWPRTSSCRRRRGGERGEGGGGGEEGVGRILLVSLGSLPPNLRMAQVAPQEKKEERKRGRRKRLPRAPRPPPMVVDVPVIFSDKFQQLFEFFVFLQNGGHSCQRQVHCVRCPCSSTRSLSVLRNDSGYGQTVQKILTGAAFRFIVWSTAFVPISGIFLQVLLFPVPGVRWCRLYGSAC